MKLRLSLIQSQKALIKNVGSLIEIKDGTHPFDKLVIRRDSGADEVMFGVLGDVSAAKVVVPIHSADSSDSLYIAVPGRMVIDILTGSDNGSVMELDIDSSANLITFHEFINISAPKAKRHYTSLPMIDMLTNPDTAVDAAAAMLLNPLNWKEHAVIPIDVWKRACSIVIPASDKATGVNVLPEVRLEFEQDRISLVGTNSQVLGYASVDNNPANTGTMVLHKDFLVYANRLVNDDIKGIKIVSYKKTTMLVLVYNNIPLKIGVLCTQLETGKQLDSWTDVMSKSLDGMAFTTTVATIQHLIERAEVIAHGKAVDIMANVDGQEISISAGTVGGTELSDTVTPIRITGNGKFLLASDLVKRAISGLDKGVELEISSADNGRALIVTPMFQAPAEDPGYTINAGQVWGTRVI